MSGIFKAYDIRGLYPQEITEDGVHSIGSAFAQYLGKQRIVVGHDMREGSPILADAFINGVTAAGVDITNIGLSTTPMLYYAIIDGQFDGGAMITASHLPVHYNGVKLCRDKAIPLSSEDGLPEVEQLTQEKPAQAAKPGQRTQLDFLPRYIAKLVSFVENPQPLKIVIDTGNGMGGLDVPKLLARFPVFDVVPMYLDLDGSFPHHVPNPALPESTRDLQERVVAEKADLGIAFDGDGDRCGFVDENGERIPADLAVAVLAEYFLDKDPGATILYDLRASRVVPERIRQLGGNPVKTRVGHSFIKANMRKTNAVLAGELSGHFYFREMGFIDIGILAMISILDLLAIKKKPISQLVRPLQKYVQSGEINIKIDDAQQVFQALESKYKDGKQEHLDGLTVEYNNWWFNLRESHTEPVVRLVVEADDEETLHRQKSRLLEIINKSAPDQGGHRE
jgi:phosphomannomutase